MLRNVPTEALRWAEEIAQAEFMARAIGNDRDIVNFDYWMLRCKLESSDDTLAARKLYATPVCGDTMRGGLPFVCATCAHCGFSSGGGRRGMPASRNNRIKSDGQNS